jgi:hypothetical protein
MSRQNSNDPSGSWKMILLLIIAGAAALMISPVSADTGVTIAAQGDHSYYLGEKVVFSGHNYDSDTTYLFIAGPGTFMTGPGIPKGGGKLTSPLQAVVSGNPDSFTLVKTKPDKTWEYVWYTANLKLDAGTYNVYAVNQPKALDQAGPAAAGVGIIVKKPFITAGISPATVSKGVPFTVSGVAEGIPPNVQIWILGKNYYSNSTVSVNSDDASFRYVVPQEATSHLTGGQYFVIVQHPMVDNLFDFVVSGDYVKRNNSTNVFRISGPGSLQGSDAADALIAAINDQETNDLTSSAHDTYTVVPFQVTAPVSATAGVTIAASGTRSYYQGEKVVFSGRNYDSDTTYLFITGPGTFMNGPGVPDNGGKLTSPRQGVVSGNAGSFDTVKTKADKSWEYVYYTHNLNVNAGTYTVYAVSQPKAKDQLGPDAANVGIALKKPFITAEISPSTVSKGQPFTITGTAEGDPESVRIWILGKNYYSRATESVNPDASFRYIVPQEVTSHLESGQYFVIGQHSMQNNKFDIDVAGDYVRNLNLNNGANLFRISGPGSLQGSDAADALVAAFSDSKVCDDTYTEIPFQVTDAGNPTPQATADATAPVQSPTQPALLPLTLTGAVVLILGIVVWKRQ